MADERHRGVDRSFGFGFLVGLAVGYLASLALFLTAISGGG